MVRKFLSIFSAAALAATLLVIAASSAFALPEDTVSGFVSYGGTRTTTNYLVWVSTYPYGMPDTYYNHGTPYLINTVSTAPSTYNYWMVALATNFTNEAGGAGYYHYVNAIIDKGVQWNGNNTTYGGVNWPAFLDSSDLKGHSSIIDFHGSNMIQNVNFAISTVTQSGNKPPIGAITSPASSAVLAGTAVTFSGTAENPVGPNDDVREVGFYFNQGSDVWISSAIRQSDGGITWTSPSWDFENDGRVTRNAATIKMKAKNKYGQVSVVSIPVTINKGNPRCQIVGSYPSPISTLTTISGTAAFPLGTIQRVNFILDGIHFTTTTTSASYYNFILDPSILSPIGHTLEMRAYDNLGHQNNGTISLNFTVSAPPIAKIIYPGPNASITEGIVTISGTASSYPTPSNIIVGINPSFTQTEPGQLPMNFLSGSLYTASWSAGTNGTGTRYLKWVANIGGTAYQSAITTVTINSPNPNKLQGRIYYTASPQISGTLHILLRTDATINATGATLNIPFYNFSPNANFDQATGTYYYPYSVFTGSVAPNSYYLSAFIDSNNDGISDLNTDPSCLFGQVQISYGGNVNANLTIQNPSNMSYLKFTDPTPNKNLYKLQTWGININAQAFSAVGINKVEFYIDNVLLNTSYNYNTTYTTPFYANAMWYASSYTDGSHIITAKAYKIGEVTPTIPAQTVTINLVSTPPKIIHGNINYNVTTPKTGTIYINAYNSIDSSHPGPAISTATITSPGMFELEVPGNGRYLVKAFMDVNSHKTYNSYEDPFTSYNGPYTINSSSGMNDTWGAYMDMYDPGASAKYKIDGQVNYTSTYKMQGPVYITLSNTKNGTPIRSQMLPSPIWPVNFTIDNLDPGTSYYIGAYIDIAAVPGTISIWNAADPSGSYLSPITIVNSNMVIPQFNITNPGNTPGGGNTAATTGHNSISGQVSYADTSIGTNKIVIKAYDQYNPMTVYEKDIYGTGSYKIENMPDISNCIVQAFVDYNYDNTPNPGEPQLKVGPFNLAATAGVAASLSNKDLALVKTEVVKTPTTVTVRLRVYDSANPDKPLDGALIKMFDTGDFNNWQTDNYILKSSRTSSGSWDPRGSGANKFNVEFASVTVYQSPDSGPFYGYEFRGTMASYRMNSMRQNFQSWNSGQINYIDIPLNKKPDVSISGLTITPVSKVISPDNDGKDDKATFNFRYSIKTTQPDWNNGAQAKLVIDTNGDGNYTPMNWGMFVYIDGKQFIKWNSATNQPDPNIFVDFMNPDYTKLKGPISNEEMNKYSAQFDATMDCWIDGWSMKTLGTSMYQDIELNWEGRDNSWQPLKNGAYKWKLMIAEQGNAFDTDNLVVTPTTGTITIKTSSITGKIKDKNGAAIAGAKVDAGGPNAWGEAFTDATGAFEVSGLRNSGSNESYFVSMSAVGFVGKEQTNVIIPAAGTVDLGTLTLDSGIQISGLITIPNPPKRGALRDQWGNTMYDLWGQVQAWKTDGPGWYSSDIHVPLSDSVLTSTAAAYSIFLEPGNFQMQVNIPGYVSQTMDVTVGNSGVIKNITLSKSISLIGYVKLPIANAADLTSLKTDAQKKGYWNNIWLNMHAQSKDNKYSANSGVNFDFFELQTSTSYEKAFRFDSLVPGVTYNFTIDSQGLFALNQFTIAMPKAGDKNNGIMPLSYGAKLKGTIIIADILGNKIENNSGYNSMMGTYTIAGLPVFINIRNDNTFTNHNTMVYISSVAAGSYTYEMRGLSSGYHEIEIQGIRGVDVFPSLDSRKVFVSTVTNITTPALMPTITVRKPSGVLKGTITNSTGKSVNWSKVAVVIADVGPDSDQPVNVNVGADGTFTATNLVTSNMLVWGSEYNIKPGTTTFFGSPTGRASTFMKMVNTQSGATTYMTATLLPASTIYVRLYAADTNTIKDIIAKTTTTYPTSGGPAPCIARIQPLTLRKLGEEMDKQRSSGDNTKNAKEIAFTGTFMPNLTTPNTAVFRLNGLEKGIYFAYPLVNYQMHLGGGQNGPTIPNGSTTGPITPAPVKPGTLADAAGTNNNNNNNNNGNQDLTLSFNYASSPSDKYIVLDQNTEAYADFTLGDGVTLTGSITRPSGNYTASQVVEITLRNPATNEKVYTQTVTFSTTTRVNTLSYNFTKVSANKYVLVANTPDYKVYSTAVNVTTVSGSQSLAAIKLAKGATLTGKIVNEDGTGISDDLLISCSANPFVEGSYMDNTMASVKISSDVATRGTFTFPNLPGGTYQVKAALNDNAKINLVAKVKAGIIVPDSETTVDIGSLILKKATSIKGVVKNSSGKTLGNILVLAYPLDSQRKENNQLTTTTDKDGAFILKGVDPAINNWQVRINVRDDDPTKRVEGAVNYGTAIRFIDITKTTDLGVVTLSIANASISGTIKTPDNSQLTLPFPVAGISDSDYPAALVILQSQDDLASGDPMSGAKVITTGSGEFLIDGIVAGKYTLKVFAKRFATISSTMTIKNGVNNLGNITLAKGASVTGTIRTLDGKKISQNEASIVMASTRDFKKVVFGSLNVNPTSLEVNDYEIVGLEPGVNYFIVLVAPQTGKVYVDIKSTAAANNATYINHPVIYKKIPPSFEAKVFKVTLAGTIIKGQIPNPAGGAPLKFKGLFDDYDVDLSGISTNQSYDIYFILSFISQAVMEEKVANIVSTVTANGTMIPMAIDDSKKMISLAYIPQGTDITTGKFSLKFSGRNSEGIVGTDIYKFYLGEDGRSEKVINPMIGGNISLGQGDSSGIDLPSGLEFAGSDNDVAISSGVKAQIIKVLNETVVLAGPGTRFGPKKYSPESFSTKLVSQSAYPAGGTLMSSVYDLQVSLVAGPLASIATNSSVGVKIQISSAALNVANQNDLGLYHYDTTSGKFVPESTGANAVANIDWSNLLLTMNVNHFSKFAVFYVPGSGAISTSTSTTVATDLSNVILYPNPYKSGIANYDGAFGIKDTINIKNLTARAKIKFYNIAGELVGDYDKDNATSGTLTWDMKNKDGNKLASGVYIYYITNPDNSSQKAIGKFAIIK